MDTLAVYIHWPYCLSKCPYCDFASRPCPDALDEGSWRKAYAREVMLYAETLSGRRVTSIYFGGGTPSLMPPSLVAAVLESIAKGWALDEDCEITLEANPAAALTEKLKDFRSAGVNRLSLGVQSFDDARLKFLGRAHDGAMAVQAIEAAARLFPRFSFDLMYAFAEQSEADWARTLAHALSFGAEHVSLYQLTIEPRTPFYKRAQKERMVCDEEQAVRLYTLTQQTLEAVGMPAYEVSNHAVVGQESRHNMAYWRYQDYIGLGPAAHGRFVDAQGRWASENVADVADWMQAATDGRSRAFWSPLSFDEARLEALIMGLRLTEGLSKSKWQNHFGQDLSHFIPLQKRQWAQQEGLVVETEAFFAATAEGRQRLNALCAYLL